MDIGIHIGIVAHPFTASRTVIERIGIRVDIYQLELTVDHSGYHAAQGLVIIGKLHIRPHLRSGIPEPHGVYIAGIDKRVVHTVLLVLTEMHSGVQSVGKAVGEHPCQPRIRK